MNYLNDGDDKPRMKWKVNEEDEEEEEEEKRT